MFKNGKVALFGHSGCKSKFFVKFGSETSPRYTGKCPNPHCNRKVSLLPEELFPSMDKARRKYIKLAHSKKDDIYWQS